MTISHLLQQYQTLTVANNIVFTLAMIFFIIFMTFLVISSKIQKKLYKNETVNVSHWLFEASKTVQRSNKVMLSLTAIIILLMAGHLVLSTNTSKTATALESKALQTNIIEATNYTTSKAKGPNVAKDAVKYQVLNSSFIIRPDQVTTKHQAAKLSTPQIAVKFATINTGSKKNDQQVKKIITHRMGADSWQDFVNSTAKVTIYK